MKGKRSSCAQYQVQNMGARAFRRFMRRKRTEIYVAYVNSVSAETIKENNASSFGHATDDVELKSIIHEFQDVFKDKLPNELPPVRDIDHEIQTDPGEKIPNRGLYRLSPDELRATREYIEENMRSGRIRPSKSPYGAPLFLRSRQGSLFEQWSTIGCSIR